jgi:di/tripeptidase
MISTDGTTTLGADDKAGVSVLIWNITYLDYTIFIGEEVGCIGSGQIW